MFEPEAQIIPDIFFEMSEVLSAPKPTLLYSLQPRGIGTASCESLKSYMFRLADAHRVSPSQLVSDVLWKLHPEKLRNAYRGFERMVYRLNWLAVPRENAASMTRALSSVTGQNNLEYLTLAPISHVFVSNGLTSKKERLCPFCIQEDIHGWRAHGRLVWAIASVTACPIHRIKLIDRNCRATIERPIPIFRRKRMPGVCDICGSIGYRCLKGVIEQASEQEIWRSGQVGLLVESFPRAATIYSPQKTIKGIKRLIDLHSKGNNAAAARTAGIARAIISEWINGVWLPNIERLLDLCQASSYSLVSVLNGVPENVPSPPMKLFSPRLRLRPYKVIISECEHLLKEALNRKPPLSFRAICINAGLDPKTLSVYFPGISSKLVKRYADYLQTCRQEKKHRLLKEAEKTLQDMKCKGIRPTMRNIREFSGKVLFPQSNFRRAFDEVLARNQGHSFR